MIARLLGYIIGGALLLALIAPVPVSAWLWFDRLSTLLTGNEVNASIDGCEKRSVSRGGKTNAGWVPVATLADGSRVVGDFKVKSQSWCEWQKTTNASVFITGDKRVINNFWQFYFFPLLMTLISALIIWMGIAGIKKKRRQKQHSDISS